jgi:hypothetical protein
MDENEGKNEKLIDKKEENNNGSGENVSQLNTEEKLVEKKDEDLIKKDTENKDIKIQKKNSGEIQLNTEEEIENLYKELNEKRLKVKEKIKEISEYLIVKGEELYYIEQEFTNKKQRWIKNIYKRCCCCECGNSCCKCCHCFCCCYKKKYIKYKEKINNKVEEIIEKEMKLEKIPIRLSNQNNNYISWIQYEKLKNFCFFISNEKLRYFCSSIGFYFLTIFHFIALSEVHGFLLALFKEIERTLKRYIMKYYDFDKNEKGEDIVKTFYYYLTESNYHDSSQINFNYLSSLFTLFVIKKFNSYYNIALVYLVSIIFVTIFSSILLSYNYYNEKDLKNDDKNYNVWKLIFGFMLPYSFIYIFAGFISLLPNKILDEIYSNEKLSGNLNKLIYINLCIGISVMIKNYINKFWIHLNATSVYYILFFEIIIFAGSSLIYLLYLFLLLFITKKKIKKEEIHFKFIIASLFYQLKNLKKELILLI